MTEPITVGAIVLTVSIAALFAAVRAWPGPCQHRATAVEVPFAELMPDWPQPVYGAAVPQAFRHCRGCREDTPVVLHPGAYHCTTARHITFTTAGGR